MRISDWSSDVCSSDLDGTILTVLTLEMYCGKYGQNTTDRRICRVVNQMVHAGLVPAEMWKPGDKDEYVTVYAFLKSGTLRLALGAWKGSVPSAALAGLASNQ